MSKIKTKPVHKTKSRASLGHTLKIMRFVILKILASIVTGIFMSAMFLAILFLLIDITRYPFTGSNIDSKMSNVNVVNFETVQGSRIYVTYEDGSYNVFVFGVGLFGRRYRQMFTLNIENEFAHAIVLGRTRNFSVFITGDEINYEIYRRYSPGLATRFNGIHYFTFIGMSISVAISAYMVISKKFSKK